ncbi:hypothetical protein LTS07_007216 [Exophiala sideris]|nr:hypothetical protein LTS07_007216 [Exophiala sideris]KAK5033921.1 hypothetical protein LTR13_006521 [Exophiala sideris]KAK5180863.1 hypothetical protein LTR44_006683 [Eurotiomycetes sp. CCFEE 6388]
MLFPLRLFRHFQHVHLLMKGNVSWSAGSLDVVESLKYLLVRGNILVLFRCYTTRRLAVVDPQHSKLKAHHLSPADSKVASQPLIGDDVGGTTQRTWFGSKVFPGQGGPLKAFPLHPHTSHGLPPEDGPKLLSAMDGDLMVSADVLDLCLRWRDSAEYIRDLTVAERDEVRKWFSWQLATIDTWLKDYGGQDALCAALNLLAQQFPTSRDMLKVRNGFPHPRLAVLDDDLKEPEIGEVADDEHNYHLVLFDGDGNRTLHIHAGSDYDDPLPSSQSNAGTRGQLQLEWHAEGGPSASHEETDPQETRSHSIREPRDDEHSVMSRFARHIKRRRCGQCPDLYQMRLQEGATFCDRGLEYARDFARYIYPHGGRPFSVVDRQRGAKVELELDEVDSEVVLAMLFAMEKGLWVELFEESEEPILLPEPRPAYSGRRANVREGTEAASTHDAEARRERSREEVRPIKQPKDRIEAMETILLFRAVLYAALASTAIDSSDILEMRDRDELVQVL